ncbi:MAG: class I SAM-dependent methyltransferase [Bacteroidota bacterium]
MSNSQQDAPPEGHPTRQFHSPRDKKRLLETLAYKQAGHLLELGFGHGGFLSLASRYFHIVGIDHSHKRVAEARAANDGRVYVKRADIETEDLGVKHFDVVAAFNILEHLHAPHKTVDKVYRGLRDTGILIGSVPNNQPLLGKIHTELTNLGDPTHYSTYSPTHWQRIFDGAGFREIIFFGELLFTKYVSLYIHNPFWRYYCYNLLFVCRK